MDKRLNRISENLRKCLHVEKKNCLGQVIDYIASSSFSSSGMTDVDTVEKWRTVGNCRSFSHD